MRKMGRNGVWMDKERNGLSFYYLFFDDGGDINEVSIFEVYVVI